MSRAPRRTQSTLRRSTTTPSAATRTETARPLPQKGTAPTLISTARTRRARYQMRSCATVAAAPRPFPRTSNLERHGDLAFAFAEFFVVGAAYQRPFDIDVITLAQLRRCVLAEAVPGNDAMPLGLRVPFFVSAFPGPLSRQRQNRVFAVRRSNRLVLRVLAEITDEMNSVLVHFLSPFLPL